MLMGSLLGIAAQPASPATLDRVRESGTLRLGYVVDARPFSYRDASGKATGYAVTLCERVTAAVKQELGLPGLRAELVPLTLAERREAVAQGRVDLFCGADTATLGRREHVDFSIPIFPGGVGALMREDAPSRMRKILSGEPEPERPRWRASLGQILEKRTFSVHAGTTTQKWLEGRLEEFDIIAEIDPVDSYDTGVDRVLARRADVLFGDRAILMDAATRSASADDLIVLGRQFTYEPLALGLERGDSDFRLLVDRTLSRLYRSGEISAIYAPHFGQPDEAMQQFFERSALPE